MILKIILAIEKEHEQFIFRIGMASSSREARPGPHSPVEDGRGSGSPKVVSCWLPKGGVAKSTRTLELGYSLSHLGFKTIMLEFDPQRDLTKRVFNNEQTRARYNVRMVDPARILQQSGHHQPQDTADDDDGVDDELPPFYYFPDLEDFYNKSNHHRPNNVYDTVRSQYLGEGSTALNTPELVEILPPSSEGRGGLFLLPGHPQINKLDEQVALAYNGLSGSQIKATVFNDLCGKLAQKYRPDIILVDLSPDKGALNGLVILSSDLLVLPCIADSSSFAAISDVIPAMETWHYRHERQRTDIENPHRHKMRRPEVAIAGTIQSHFTCKKKKKKGEGKPPKRRRQPRQEAENDDDDDDDQEAADLEHTSAGAEGADGGQQPLTVTTKAFLMYMKCIDYATSEVLVPAVRGINDGQSRLQLLDGQAYINAGVSTEAYCLGRMPDYHSIANVAHRCGTPAPFLTSNQFPGGAQRVSSWRNVIDGISLRILKLLGKPVPRNPELEETPQR